MKNAGAWRETKFECTQTGKWRSSRVSVPLRSRIAADRAAATYQSAIERFARGRLLDLGCGTAPLYGIYGSRASEVVCVDWQSSLHETAHVDIFADLNAPLLEIEVASFDTVIASDVIEHLHTPDALFETVGRVLVDGGHLILGVPFLYWVHEQPHDYHRYTRFALDRYCAGHALEVVEIVPWAGAPEVLVDLCGKALASWPSISAVLIRTALPLLKLGPVRKLSRVSSETIPMGYTLIARRAAREP